MIGMFVNSSFFLTLFDRKTLDDTDKKTMAVSLPEDLILFQIITRVPAKSVIRFKCVSKQWNLFLMSEKFKQMHNRNHLKDPHLEDHNLLFYSKAAATTFFTIDCESLPIKRPRRRPLPQFEAIPPQYMSILSSYHGLILIATLDCQDEHIFLWNPLTTEYKRLSKPSNPDHIECYEQYGRGYGLYYSSCEDDYKLLVVTYSKNVYIYSLKSDSWRKLNKKVPFPEVDNREWEPGFHLSEYIYFRDRNLGQGLIKFDTTAETFHKIETPPKYDNTYIHYYPLSTTTVHKGPTHLCVKYNIYDRISFVKRTCIELWKFNADRDIWSKVVTYQFGPKNDIGDMFPLHLMSNGNWLMKDYREEGRICQVELKKMYTEDKDGHDEYKVLNYSDIIVSYPEKVRYTETFVSPNKYMK